MIVIVTSLSIGGRARIIIPYKENAVSTIQPDGIIWRLTIQFEKLQSGHLLIKDWIIPSSSMLFIFDDEYTYTGPYLNGEQNEYLSGRFISDTITLEYYESINAAFSGNFIIQSVKAPEIQVSQILSQKIIINHYKKNRERPKILVTGYWPPTNEMVRHFSQNPDLNPDGWQGDNWENLGFDVVSFFPEFDPDNCNNCGQGYGDLEVDYQDFSGDFWPIVEQIKPAAIITACNR